MTGNELINAQNRIRSYREQVEQLETQTRIQQQRIITLEAENAELRKIEEQEGQNVPV